MSFLDKLKKKFSANETFDVEETTAAGDIITIVTEDENPKVGDQVNDSEGKPLPDGDVVLKDGSTLVIAGGKIAEIKDAEADPPPPDEEPTMAEMMQSFNAMRKSFDKFQTTYKKDLKESQEGMELIADQVQKFDGRLTTLAKSVTSKKTTYEAEPPAGGKKKNNASGYDPDKVREARENRKKK